MKTTVAIRSKSFREGKPGSFKLIFRKQRSRSFLKGIEGLFF